MRGHRGWLAVLAAATSLLAAGPARAAFPGRNGLLALDPAGGTGIVLASPTGHVERTVCPGPVIASPEIVGTDCTHISGASWSPDGRVLLFRQDGDVSLIYADGSCLACREGSGDPVTGAAFTRRGDLLLTETTAGRRGVVIGSTFDTVLATAYNASRLRLPLYTAPRQPTVVSPTEGAFVARRHGHLWIATRTLVPLRGGRPWKLRWLVAGSAPSFSPDGRRLVFSRAGWIRLLTLSTHRARRLVRGTSAAFSPDGRLLAVIGNGDTVSIVTLATGRARTLHGLHATNADWQPLVATPPSCLLPPGSKVEASGPAGQVQIYTDGSSHLACLQTTHETRQLATSFFHDQIGISGFQFAGSTIAYILSRSPEEFSCFPQLEYVMELDLTSATSRISDQVQNGCDPGQGELQLDSWVLAPSGAVAYIVSSSVEDMNTGATTYGQALIVHDAAGTRRVDSVNESTSGTPAPVLRNLAVNGSTLTWEHAGQPQSAQLGGAP